MRNWPLRQGVNKYQAPLVRLHTQRQRRRQGIDACTPNALQDGQQLAEVHGHFLLRHGESSTPKTNVVLHVIDLLKQPRTDCVIRRIRAQNELVGIVRRVVQRRVNESRAQRVKVPLLLVPKLPVHAVLQQVRQRVRAGRIHIHPLAALCQQPQHLAHLRHVLRILQRADSLDARTRESRSAAVVDLNAVEDGLVEAPRRLRRAQLHVVATTTTEQVLETQKKHSKVVVCIRRQRTVQFEVVKIFG